MDREQVVPWIATLVLAGFLVWATAVISVLRAKTYAWRAAAGTRKVWLGVLVATFVLQRLLPKGGLGAPAAVAALSYLVLVRPRLRRAEERRHDSHVTALGEVGREAGGKDRTRGGPGL